MSEELVPMVIDADISWWLESLPAQQSIKKLIRNPGPDRAHLFLMASSSYGINQNVRVLLNDSFQYIDELERRTGFNAGADLSVDWKFRAESVKNLLGQAEKIRDKLISLHRAATEIVEAQLGELSNQAKTIESIRSDNFDLQRAIELRRRNPVSSFLNDTVFRLCVFICNEIEYVVGLWRGSRS